jgi:hypothetical protein
MYEENVGKFYFAEYEHQHSTNSINLEELKLKERRNS